MPYKITRTMSEGHYQQSIKSSGSSERQNIKSKSHSQTKAQWKETIRRGCLERAKIARRERLRKSRGQRRSDSTDIGDCSSNYKISHLPSSKRDRDESISEWSGSELNNEVMVDHTPGDYQSKRLSHMESGDSVENVVNTARVLVEQELQRALSGMHHCHQVCPLDGSVPSKKVHCAGSEVVSRELDSMESEELSDLQSNAEEYKISQEEFAELLNDVTEELQREGECVYCIYPDYLYSNHIEKEKQLSQIITSS